MNKNDDKIIYEKIDESIDRMFHDYVDYGKDEFHVVSPIDMTQRVAVKISNYIRFKYSKLSVEYIFPKFVANENMDWREIIMKPDSEERCMFILRIKK